MCISVSCFSLSNRRHVRFSRILFRFRDTVVPMIFLTVSPVLDFFVRLLSCNFLIEIRRMRLFRTNSIENTNETKRIENIFPLRVACINGNVFNDRSIFGKMFDRDSCNVCIFWGLVSFLVKVAYTDKHGNIFD